MYTRRLHQLVEQASAQGFDTLALVPGPNLFYLTGLSFHVSERPIVALFPVDENPIIVLPELEGKLDGMAIRVPTPNVSVVDLTAEVERKASDSDINAAMKRAAEGVLKGVLYYTDEPLVSTDFKGNPASSIFDAMSTMVLDGNLAKTIAWYDNEWGYACRVGDLCAFLVSKGV